MNLQKTKGNLLLLLTTLIWGATFVAQDKAMLYIGPYTFQTVRSLVGAAVLVPVILFFGARRKRQEGFAPATKKDKLYLLRAGVICGFFLAVASCFQQVGIASGTSAGKAGFITALYIFFVPIFGLVLKKKVQPHIWGCVVLAAVGLYFLCIKQGSLHFAIGDLLMLGSAFVFGFQILSVDHFAPRVSDCVALASLQFLFSGLFSSIPMLIFEWGTKFSSVLDASGYILFAGVLSCGVAYTLQIVGQKYTEPTIASLIMSFEAVFAVLAGMIVPPHVIPTPREWLGSALMFIAILLAQITFPTRKKKA